MDTARLCNQEATGLNLGAPLQAHMCHYCRDEMDSLATHGLSCRWWKRHHCWHAAMNDTLHSSLSAAKAPSCMEHQASTIPMENDLMASQLEVPWKSGKLLVWDTTCTNAFATRETGAVVALAEERNRDKYTPISTSSTQAFSLDRDVLVLQTRNLGVLEKYFLLMKASVGCQNV